MAYRVRCALVAPLTAWQSNMTLLDQSDIDTLYSAGSDAESPPARKAETSPARVTTISENEPALDERYRLRASQVQLDRLVPIRLSIKVRLAERRMKVDQLLDLNVGTIIEFDRSADAVLELYANNVPIGIGNAVKCGEKFGLRVIRIQPLAQRLIASGLIR